MNKYSICIVFICLSLVSYTFSEVGDTRICQWKDDKVGAFTIGADDNLGSQLDNMVPELKKRNLVATFWICPGSESFKKREDEWRQLSQYGFDFANHTMRHKGAHNYQQAEYEIGEAAKRIRDLNPKQGKLQLFHHGGGTDWRIKEDQIREIGNKYGVYCFFGEKGRGIGNLENPYINLSEKKLKEFVERPLKTKDWSFVIFHGIDGDYMQQSLEAFIFMLDHMQKYSDKIWFPTCTQAHKYKMEHLNSKVSINSAKFHKIELSISSTLDKELYDFPLTLKTEVPPWWNSCTITQNGESKKYLVKDGYVLFETLPNNHTIIISEGGHVGKEDGSDFVETKKEDVTTIGKESGRDFKVLQTNNQLTIIWGKMWNGSVKIRIFTPNGRTYFSYRAMAISGKQFVINLTPPPTFYFLQAKTLDGSLESTFEINLK